MSLSLCANLYNIIYCKSNANTCYYYTIQVNVYDVTSQIRVASGLYNTPQPKMSTKIIVNIY